MNQLENNLFFWQKLDTLLLSASIHINQPKGSCHETFTNLIYPVDYGYLSDTTGSDQAPIHIYRGSQPANKVQAIVVSADILKKDCVVKLLTGCTEEEVFRILEFLNQTQFQKAILVRRGREIPVWAQGE